MDRIRKDDGAFVALAIRFLGRAIVRSNANADARQIELLDVEIAALGAHDEAA